jgi:nicotinamide mononucleotide transporter
MNLTNLFDVNAVFFTVLNYPMSYVEFFGTIFTAWSVYLAAKNKVSNWPVGIVGIILYTFLFYQIHLYSDLLEQIYYFITGFWGWWLWTHPKKNISQNQNELQVSYTGKKGNLTAIISVVILSFGLGYLMTKIHLLLPTFFPVAASFAYLDAFTTILSFVATIYLAKRKIENWYLWILVDFIGVWLYYQKGVVFISLLYFAFLINAFVGYFGWVKIYKKYVNQEI